MYKLVPAGKVPNFYCFVNLEDPLSLFRLFLVVSLQTMILTKGLPSMKNQNQNKKLMKFQKLLMKSQKRKTKYGILTQHKQLSILVTFHHHKLQEKKVNLNHLRISSSACRNTYLHLNYHTQAYREQFLGLGLSITAVRMDSWCNIGFRILRQTKGSGCFPVRRYILRKAIFSYLGVALNSFYLVHIV